MKWLCLDRMLNEEKIAKTEPLSDTDRQTKAKTEQVTDIYIGYEEGCSTSEKLRNRNKEADQERERE